MEMSLAAAEQTARGFPEVSASFWSTVATLLGLEEPGRFPLAKDGKSNFLGSSGALSRFVLNTSRRA
jgi:hypothetical protein